MREQPQTREEWVAWARMMLGKATATEIREALSDMGEQVTYLHRVRVFCQEALAEATEPREPTEHDPAYPVSDAFVSARQVLALSGLASASDENHE